VTDDHPTSPRWATNSNLLSPRILGPELGGVESLKEMQKNGWVELESCRLMPIYRPFIASRNSPGRHAGGGP
jgi:hypothetical protein